MTGAQVPAARPSTRRDAAPPPAFVNDVYVYVTTYPGSLTVGDRATLEVVVEAPPDLQVLFPPGNAVASRKITVVGVEVEEPPRPPTEATRRDVAAGDEAAGDATQEGDDAAEAAPDREMGTDAAGRARWIARYTIGVYDVGEVVLPPWPVQVQSDSEAAMVHSDSVRFFVASVLDDSLAAADIRDLKPQRRLPVPLGWWVWVALAALVVLVAFGLLRRRLRRRAQAVVPLPPPLPAHEVALADLRKLETLRLPFEGKIKQHYMGLSEILRTYLENAPQFRLRALEETTHEIVQELNERRFKKDVVDELTALCEEADLVKFAKHEPAIDQCNTALERTRRFVLDTAKTSALLDLPLQPELVAAGASVVGVAAGTGLAPGTGTHSSSAAASGNGAGTLPPDAPEGGERA